MTNKLFFLSFLVFTAAAFADVNVAQLQQQMPAATPFEVLKKAFDSAGPAQMSDYPKVVDLYTSRSNLKCVGVGVGDVHTPPEPGSVAPVYIGRFDYKISGKPENGPLFPGTPDKVTTVLSMVISGNIDSIRPIPSDDSIVNLVSETELNMPSTAITGTGDLQTTVTSQNLKDYLAVVTYRKSGSELIFHEVVVNPSQKKSSEIFGYCYPSSN